MSSENHDTSLVRGRYNERYRPHIHFTPESMWMNDPNGLVYFEEEYHLFYQYHPNGKQWGPMHWGHAVSDDLFNWKHLPIALHPDELGMIFSGSVVVDWHDMSGFFNGDKGLVAFYTHADDELQRQSMAYSKDKGRTWIKYDGNPVIKNPGIQDFRDPKVLWHQEKNQWVMVVTAGRKIWFYTSKNLKDWTFVSEFGEGWGAQEGVWECPDLFPLKNNELEEEKWILQIGIDAGGPAGGSGTQYFVGEFDGLTFTPSQKKEEVKWLDYGNDFYAAQSFSDTPENRRIILAWMSNWQYANDVPTDPWRSAMSLPRELRLTKKHGKYMVTQAPVSELLDLKTSESRGGGFKLKDSEPYKFDQPKAPFQLDFEVGLDNSSGFEARLFADDEKSRFVFGLDRIQNVFYINRDFGSEDAFSKDFAGVFTVPIEGALSKLDVSIVCDHSSVEVFINDGEYVMTNLYLPAKRETYRVEFTPFKEDVTVESITVSELEAMMVKNGS